MTTARVTQLPIVTVAGTGAATTRVSQLATITIGAPLSPTRISQIAIVTVVANGKTCLPLGPVTPLGCWSPCGMLAHRFGIVPEGI